MGTGIVHTLLFLLPWPSTHAVFRDIGLVFLVATMLLFICFSIAHVSRYIIFRGIFGVMIRHESHSLFLGTIPMGFVTIVSGIVVEGYAFNLPHVVYAASGLWWLALVMSMLTATAVPYAMMTLQKQSQQGLTALWLLPVVPPITVAAVGSSIAADLVDDDPSYALTILLTSYVMLGIGFLLAFMILTLYFERLTMHHMPAREVIVSTFLPLGPCGQAGYALIELGKVCMTLFPALAARNPDRPGRKDLSPVGPAMYGCGLVLGLMLWGLGMWWALLAIVSVGQSFMNPKETTFSMGWWSFTFPLGSMTLLTLSLASAFDSLFFKVVATIMTGAVLALWLLVAIPTAIGFVRGTQVFQAPCLADLPDKEARETGAHEAEKGSAM
ncbi:uncharacterized protein L969DRAFT_89761 [Mixia osmundae IAM 14324]|uniref:uncharacterized protein n=1 Tax=Mixia osmundae (strain CBS 9802 / IAM 14324 / JCM 22182 / KY 12970) TaxID=764103 RepID=UPI0004A54BDF|nr:uncharacterized protein L969DRAFT_89761 [Mixia osmundae IAM 14324]KEI37788.1 hypothetical protein L969DRAFT_89761 [Mixia osmundae IAM 14324]